MYIVPWKDEVPFESSPAEKIILPVVQDPNAHGNQKGKLALCELCRHDLSWELVTKWVIQACNLSVTVVCQKKRNKLATKLIQLEKRTPELQDVRIIT